MHFNNLVPDSLTVSTAVFKELEVHFYFEIKWIEVNC